jgi:hypothetical protein
LRGSCYLAKPCPWTREHPNSIQKKTISGTVSSMLKEREKCTAGMRMRQCTGCRPILLELLEWCKRWKVFEQEIVEAKCFAKQPSQDRSEKWLFLTCNYCSSSAMLPFATLCKQIARQKSITFDPNITIYYFIQTFPSSILKNCMSNW